MWPQGISGYEWRGTAAACMAFVKSLPSWFRACVLWEGQTQIRYLRSHMCRPKNSHKQRPSPRLTQKRREIIKPQPSVYTIVMETADLSVPGAPGPSLGFEDYSVYTNLSDEELIQIAIERSLFSEDHNTTPSTGTRQTPCPPNAEVSRRSTPAHLHSTSTQPGSQRIDSSSTKPSPLQQPSVTTTALYSSPNPPTTKRVQRVEDPLFVAIRAGDVNRVRKLVNVPGWKQVSSINPDWLAIHQAAAYGQEACLRLLLSAQPGMVNKKAEKEQTALMLAVDNEHVDCVRLLLESGANPEIVNEDRETPLYKACERNNAKLVATLISHGAELNTPCILGFRALHEAVVQNNVEICELLVKAGAKLSPVNNYGMTPLCEAAQSGKLETLRFLVTHGADIDKQASDESTALYEAAKNDHENIVELLLSLDADASIPGRRGLLPLHIAAQKGSYSMVSMLMSATSKTRVRRTGISPLHLAAENDHDDVLELLISAGFDPNAQLSTEWTKLYEDRRSTALYSSVFNNNLEAITMLLEAGANPNLDFFCPLLVAVRQGCVQTLRLLLEHGANVNAYVPLHRTSFPASILFSLKQLHVLKLLLDNGCDARSCFTCDYGSGPHPPIKVTRFERFGSDDTRDHYTQFCEIISMDSISRWAGPIIDVLLDYVGHVTLCSRLQEHLNSYPDWQGIKEKAAPPWRLMQLCRLKIRQQVGIQRLRDIETLPLPGTLIRFLQYQQEASVDEPQESWEHWQDMNSWS